MTYAGPAESKRSWRGGPRGTLVRRSRGLWRWLLSGLALLLIVLAVLWAWPRPLPRTALLVLTSDREERTLPLVPFAEGDRDALLGWARAARVATCQRQLTEIATPAALVRQLALDPNPANRLPFTLPGGGELQLVGTDAVVIYIKGHGLALDISDGDKPDVRPLVVKSLSESDLSGPWFRDDAHVIDVAALLQELASVSELRKLIIFDAVHLNYDPRLGTLINAFPAAVTRAVEQLPRRNNLWVLIGQGDGELAAGIPDAARSALIDSLVQLLEQKPKGPRLVKLDWLVSGAQGRINELSRGGRGSFRQTLQSIFPPSVTAEAAFVLPTSPPPAADDSKGGKTKGPSAAETAVKVAQASPAASAVVTAAQQVAGSPVGQAIQPPGQPPAAQQGSGAAVTPDAAPAVAQPPASDAAAVAGAAQRSAAAAVAASSTAKAPKSDLDLAWEARDRLRSHYRDGWTPAHVAPDQWRRLESLLAGFDEEELCHGRSARDQATLEQIRTDLTRLEAVFRGEQAAPGTEECQNIAEAQRRFASSAAYRSFQARQAGGLDGANEALKVFAEGIYRALDYVRLHGQTSTVLDGGPLVNESSLETLLVRLSDLRNLLNPASLSDGRLTDARLRELTRGAREVESLRETIDEDIVAYARTTAAAPQSPGKLLRARLLLHSPLLAADSRRALRQSASAPSEATMASRIESMPSSAPSTNERLAANLRLYRKLLSCIEGGKKASDQRGTAVNINRLIGAADSADIKAGMLSWASLGRQFRLFAEASTATVKSDYAGRAGGQPELAAADTFDLYLTTLLIDGRDARRWHDRSVPTLPLAQPLRPELMADRVELAASSQRLQLTSPGADGKELMLTIRVQSERPPPFAVVLDLGWDARDVNVVRQDGGRAIQRGRNELVLENEKSELTLRVVSRRESTEPTTSPISIKARFGGSPQASADIACVLPRPDQVDLTIAADDNLEAARRRTWFGHGQQGGRLNFFANRERSLNLYLTNLSSEDKKLHARLYRVPNYAAGKAGRLFDARGQLHELPAGLNVQLSQPGADFAQLLRGLLIAQTNEKEPVSLPTSQAPVRVPLVAAAGAPPPAASGAAATAPAQAGEDITAGLLLVLSSADGKGTPYLKWIELQMLPPDDLLEIKEPTLREGTLSFRVGLKDQRLFEEMGLAKQPLAIVWDSQPLPPEVQVTKKEATIAPGETPTAELLATVAGTVRWPIFIQLYVDRDPRGLVFSLDRRGDSLTVSNYKENRPPVVRITRLAATAQRSGGQAEKYQLLFGPTANWLAFPSPAATAGGAPLRDPGQPVLIRVDEKTPTVRLDLDFGADVAPKYFGEGAAVRVAVPQQRRDFFADRHIAVRLLGIDGGGLRMNSDVSDFVNVELQPIDVKQDMRINLVADVVGEKVGFSTSEVGPDVIPLVLDRTPPALSQPSAVATPPRPATTPGAPQQSWLVMQCSAHDGEGSGVAKVEFVVGFDLNSNDRLDETERRPPIEAVRVAEGVYAAEYPLPSNLPGEHLVVEATASDNVGHVSPAVRSSVVIRRKVEGGQRTTFGGKKIEPEPPPGKKGR